MSQMIRCGIPAALTTVLALSAFAAAQKQTMPPDRKKNVGNSILKQDGGDPFHKPWIEEDVAWIITDEERTAFKLLQNDEQRDQFIDAFWARRNPAPDALGNEYKVEHYHRIAYVNSHFGARIPGWKTDRGRIYIVYGPPDKIESYPFGRTQDKTPEGEADSPYPLEGWRYRYLEGVGMDVVVNFVDVCSCGDFRMKMPPELKDALLVSSNGLSGEPQNRIEPVSPGIFLQPANPSLIKFKDLEALLNGRPPAKAIPFEARIEFENATRVTSLVTVAISVRYRDVTFVDEAGGRRGKLNFFGRFTSLTGRVVEEFEDSIEITVPKESAASAHDEMTYVKKTFALPIGRYRLSIAMKDANSDQSDTWFRSVVVASR